MVRAALLFAVFASAVCAQQDYVGRFDIYGGFSYLESPHINLAERGFEFQFGVRPKSWYTLGFDYSVSTGHTSLSPGLLTTSLQTQLGIAIRVVGRRGTHFADLHTDGTAGFADANLCRGTAACLSRLETHHAFHTAVDWRHT